MSMQFNDSREAMNVAGTPGGGSFWQRRTNVEKRLFVIIGTLSILSICLFISVVVYSTRARNFQLIIEKENRTVCRGNHCDILSKGLKEIMNTAIDPCDDFYEYVCGNWKNKFPIPPGDGSTSVFSEVDLNIRKNIHESFFGMGSGFDYKNPISSAKMLYRRCIDLFGQGQLREMVDIIEDVLGEWPMGQADDKSITVETWDDLLPMSAKSFDISIGLELNVFRDFTGGDKYILVMGKPLIPDFATKEDRLKDFVCLILGGICPNVDRDIKTVMDIASEFNKIPTILDPTKIRSLLQSNQFHYSVPTLLPVNTFKMTISQLGDKLSTEKFDWLSFLKKFFINIETVEIKPDTEMLVDVTYVKKAFELFKKTNKRDMAKFLIWRVTEKLPSKIGMTFNYTQVSDDIMYNMCSTQVQQLLPHAITSVYIKNHWPNYEQKISEIEGMVREVRDVIEEGFRVNNWVDDETRKALIKKVHSVESRIAFPKWILNATAIELYYQVGQNVSTPIDYMLEILGLSWTHKMRQVNTKVNRAEDWLPTTELVNAFNYPLLNIIQFPVGILNFPFYEYKQPRAWMYGAIGNVIAHEIFHSFDTNGIQYNELGAFGPVIKNNITWQKYEEKVNCLKNQYGSIKVALPDKETHLPANLTVNEDIADNSGVIASFQAFINSNVNDEIDGLDFSVSKLYFISQAALWCADYRDEYLEARLKDVHSLNKYRVIIPLRNHPKFARVFKCPLGSNMNPKNKCSIW